MSSPLEHGVVVGGELRDPEALADALREFFKRHKLARKRGVRLGIANNRIGVRTLDIVGIDDPKLLDNAIRFRAQEVLPIPLEDAVLDYHVISESVDGEGQQRRAASCSSSPTATSSTATSMPASKAGLQIVGIDLEAFALLRALAGAASDLQPLPGVERGALVAVAIGHDRTHLRRLRRPLLRVHARARVGRLVAERRDRARPRHLAERGRAGQAGALVRRVRRELPEGFNDEQLAAAQEAARRQLQTFARELVSSLQFYQNQPGSLSIGEIVSRGGTRTCPASPRSSSG